MDVGSSVRSKRKVTWESDGSNPEAEEPSSGVQGHFEDQQGVSPQARTTALSVQLPLASPKHVLPQQGPSLRFNIKRKAGFSKAHASH